MIDLISRQAAIDELKTRRDSAKDWYDKASADGDEMIIARADSAMMSFVESILTVKNLPSVQTEPCDAISRADAIRVASGYCHPANVAQELAKLPSVQAEPKWIPCSKRLPEEAEARYWVCTDGGYQCQCRWTNDLFGLGEGDTWTWKIFDIPQYSKVIAWMPLPEPYSPGCADKNGGTE